MSNPDPVLAICVNWNGRDVLDQTLDSLLRSSYTGLDVLVVDNGSEDDSISSLPEDVRLVKLESNLGYGGAINAIIRTRLETDSSTYFLLLNNDVIVAEDTVSTLVEYAQDKEPAVLGPRIVRIDDPNRLEAAWGKVTWSHVLARFCGKNARKSGSRWEQTRQVDLLLGSVLLVHRKVFEKVGLFDENFFMYHEEVDFLFRARQSGIPAYYCPSTEVAHYGAHSTRQQPHKKTYWIRRNAVYFLRKHRAGGLKWSYFWTTLGISLFCNTLMLRWSKVRTIWKAVKEGLAN